MKLHYQHWSFFFFLLTLANVKVDSAPCYSQFTEGNSNTNVLGSNSGLSDNCAAFDLIYTNNLLLDSGTNIVLSGYATENQTGTLNVFGKYVHNSMDFPILIHLTQSNGHADIVSSSATVSIRHRSNSSCDNPFSDYITCDFVSSTSLPVSCNHVCNEYSGTSCYDAVYSCTYTPDVAYPVEIELKVEVPDTNTHVYITRVLVGQMDGPSPIYFDVDMMYTVSISDCTSSVILNGHPALPACMGSCDEYEGAFVSPSSLLAYERGSQLNSITDPTCIYAGNLTISNYLGEQFQPIVGIDIPLSSLPLGLNGSVHVVDVIYYTNLDITRYAYFVGYRSSFCGSLRKIDVTETIFTATPSSIPECGITPGFVINRSVNLNARRAPGETHLVIFFLDMYQGEQVSLNFVGVLVDTQGIYDYNFDYSDFASEEFYFSNCLGGTSRRTCLSPSESECGDTDAQQSNTTSYYYTSPLIIDKGTMQFIGRSGDDRNPGRDLRTRTRTKKAGRFILDDPLPHRNHYPFESSEFHSEDSHARRLIEKNIDRTPFSLAFVFRKFQHLFPLEVSDVVSAEDIYYAGYNISRENNCGIYVQIMEETNSMQIWFSPYLQIDDPLADYQPFEVGTYFAIVTTDQELTVIPLTENVVQVARLDASYGPTLVNQQDQWVFGSVATISENGTRAVFNFTVGVEIRKPRESPWDGIYIASQLSPNFQATPLQHPLYAGKRYCQANYTKPATTRIGELSPFEGLVTTNVTVFDNPYSMITGPRYFHFFATTICTSKLMCPSDGWYLNQDYTVIADYTGPGYLFPNSTAIDQIFPDSVFDFQMGFQISKLVESDGALRDVPGDLLTNLQIGNVNLLMDIYFQIDPRGFMMTMARFAMVGSNCTRSVCHIYQFDELVIGLLGAHFSEDAEEMAHEILHINATRCLTEILEAGNSVEEVKFVMTVDFELSESWIEEHTLNDYHTHFLLYGTNFTAVYHPDLQMRNRTSIYRADHEYKCPRESFILENCTLPECMVNASGVSEEPGVGYGTPAVQELHRGSKLIPFYTSGECPTVVGLVTSTNHFEPYVGIFIPFEAFGFDPVNIYNRRIYSISAIFAIDNNRVTGDLDVDAAIVTGCDDYRKFGDRTFVYSFPYDCSDIEGTTIDNFAAVNITWTNDDNDDPRDITKYGDDGISIIVLNMAADESVWLAGMQIVTAILTSNTQIGLKYKDYNFIFPDLGKLCNMPTGDCSCENCGPPHSVFTDSTTSANSLVYEVVPVITAFPQDAPDLRRRVDVNTNGQVFLQEYYNKSGFVYPYYTEFSNNPDEFKSYQLAGEFLTENENCGIHVHMIECSNNLQVWVYPNISALHDPDVEDEMVYCDIVTDFANNKYMVVPLTAGVDVKFSGFDTDMQNGVQVLVEYTHDDETNISTTAGVYGFEIRRPREGPAGGIYVRCNMFYFSDVIESATLVYPDRSYCQSADVTDIQGNHVNISKTPVGVFDVFAQDLPLQNPFKDPALSILAALECPSKSFCPEDGWYVNDPYVFVHDYTGPAYAFDTTPLSDYTRYAFDQSFYFNISQSEDVMFMLDQVYLDLVANLDYADDYSKNEKPIFDMMVYISAPSQFEHFESISHVFATEGFCAESDFACTLTVTSQRLVDVLGQGPAVFERSTPYVNHYLLRFRMQYCLIQAIATYGIQNLMIHLQINMRDVSSDSEDPDYYTYPNNTISTRLLVHGVRFAYNPVDIDVFPAVEPTNGTFLNDALQYDYPPLAFFNYPYNMSVLYRPREECQRLPVTPSFDCQGACPRHLFTSDQLSIDRPIHAKAENHPNSSKVFDDILVSQTSTDAIVDYITLQADTNPVDIQRWAFIGSNPGVPTVQEALYHDLHVSGNVIAINLGASVGVDSEARIKQNRAPPSLTGVFVFSGNGEIARRALNDLDFTLQAPLAPGIYLDYNDDTDNLHVLGFVAGFLFKFSSPSVISSVVFYLALVDTVILANRDYYSVDADLISHTFFRKGPLFFQFAFPDAERCYGDHLSLVAFDPTELDISGDDRELGISDLRTTGRYNSNPGTRYFALRPFVGGNPILPPSYNLAIQPGVTLRFGNGIDDSGILGALPVVPALEYSAREAFAYPTADDFCLDGTYYDASVRFRFAVYSCTTDCPAQATHRLKNHPNAVSSDFTPLAAKLTEQPLSSFTTPTASAAYVNSVLGDRDLMFTSINSNETKIGYLQYTPNSETPLPLDIVYSHTFDPDDCREIINDNGGYALDWIRTNTRFNDTGMFMDMRNSLDRVELLGVTCMLIEVRTSSAVPFQPAAIEAFVWGYRNTTAEFLNLTTSGFKIFASKMIRLSPTSSTLNRLNLTVADTSIDYNFFIGRIAWLHNIHLPYLYATGMQMGFAYYDDLEIAAGLYGDLQSETSLTGNPRFVTNGPLVTNNIKARVEYCGDDAAFLYNDLLVDSLSESQSYSTSPSPSTSSGSIDSCCRRDALFVIELIAQTDGGCSFFDVLPVFPAYTCKREEGPSVLTPGLTYQVHDYFPDSDHISEIWDGNFRFGGLRIGSIWIRFTLSDYELKTYQAMKLYYTPGKSTVTLAGVGKMYAHDGLCMLGIHVSINAQFVYVNITIKAGIHHRMGEPFYVAENGQNGAAVDISDVNTGYMEMIDQNNTRIDFGLTDLEGDVYRFLGLKKPINIPPRHEFIIAPDMETQVVSDDSGTDFIQDELVIRKVWTGIGLIKVPCDELQDYDYDAPLYELLLTLVCDSFSYLPDTVGLVMFDVEAPCDNDLQMTQTPGFCSGPGCANTQSNTQSQSPQLSYVPEDDYNQLLSPAEYPPCPDGELLPPLESGRKICGLLGESTFPPDVEYDEAITYPANHAGLDSPYPDFLFNSIYFNGSMINTGRKCVRFHLPNMPGRDTLFMHMDWRSNSTLPGNVIARIIPASTAQLGLDAGKSFDCDLIPYAYINPLAGSEGDDSDSSQFDYSDSQSRLYKSEIYFPVPEYGTYIHICLTTTPVFNLQMDVEMTGAYILAVDTNRKVVDQYLPPPEDCYLTNFSFGTSEPDAACREGRDGSNVALGTEGYSSVLVTSRNILHGAFGVASFILALPFASYSVITSLIGIGVLVTALLYSSRRIVPVNNNNNIDNNQILV